MALILGSVLALANQPNAIAGADAIGWLPLALVYATPFIVVTEALLSGQNLQTVPAALLIQALSLPILFGAVSQAIGYRRYLAMARRVSSRSRA